jgi:MftR C-terminal domain
MAARTREVRRAQSGSAQTTPCGHGRSAELISADRIASHLRVVQSSFAGVITDFVKNRYPETPDIDLVAEVAGATLAAALVVAVENWGRSRCKGDLGEITATAMDLVRSGLAPLTR